MGSPKIAFNAIWCQVGRFKVADLPSHITCYSVPLLRIYTRRFGGNGTVLGDTPR